MLQCRRFCKTYFFWLTLLWFKWWCIQRGCGVLRCHIMIFQFSMGVSPPLILLWLNILVCDCCVDTNNFDECKLFNLLTPHHDDTKHHINSLLCFCNIKATLFISQSKCLTMESFINILWLPSTRQNRYMFYQGLVFTDNYVISN